MKKILYVASTVGHIKSFHLPYIEKLVALGYEVHIAAEGLKEANLKLNTENLKLINIPFEKKLLALKNLKCSFLIKELVRKEQYDIVNTHTTLAAFFIRIGLLMKWGRKPIVINTVHGYLFDEETSFIKGYIFCLAEKITKPVTNILVVMNNQDYLIAEKYGLYKDKLIKINGYGIDCKRFSRKRIEEELYGAECSEENSNDCGAILGHARERERKKIGIEKGDIALIYAAEFSKRKNQKMLINAMRKLPENTKLFLAGKGKQLEECKELAQNLKLVGGLDCENQEASSRVIFLGHVTNLEYYYYLMDICVSASRSEGLPFNIMEAMAMGLPVVATNVKGHQDLIEQEQNGYLYEFDRDSEYIQVINQAIADLKCERAEIIRETNMEKAKKYKFENVCDDIIRIVTSI